MRATLQVNYLQDERGSHWGVFQNDEKMMTFHYHPQRAFQYGEDKTTVHCQFLVNEKKESFIDNNKSIVYEVLNQKVFPDMLEKFKAEKGDALSVINFYTGNFSSTRYLGIIRQCMKNKKKEIIQPEAGHRGYQNCPFSSVTVKFG